MSSKASLTVFAMTAAGVIAVSAIVASQPGLAQTAPAGDTTSIQRGTDAEKALNLKEPAFQTREERLNAKPLDWTSTIGTPKPTMLTPAQQEALRRAQPVKAEAGAPDPKADEEARRLHPDDWK
jgi:hypothetical protein